MAGRGLSTTPWLESPEISSELRAVLACGRAVLDPEKLEGLAIALGQCTSPERLCDMALRHGMVSHLHRLAVAEGAVEVDPVLAARLGDLQRAVMVRSLRQTAILQRFLDLLEAAGIDAIPIKGPLWAQDLYGDIAMRAWSDLDLLVGHADVPEARRMLLDEGFVDKNPFNDRIMLRGKGSVGQISLHNRGLDAYIELHWEVTVGMSSRSLRPEAMFPRATTVELLGRAVACPAKADKFLITCLEGSRDRWNSVEKLLGLGVQIDRMSEGEWPGLLAEAKEAGCMRRVCLSVHCACLALDLEEIAAVEQRLRRVSVARALVESTLASRLAGQGAGGARQELADLWWDSASEDHLATGAWHALRRAFRPGPEDWSTITLPVRMRWLYGPLRPFRLAVKWLRRALRPGLRR